MSADINLHRSWVSLGEGFMKMLCGLRIIVIYWALGGVAGISGEGVKSLRIPVSI